MESKVMPAAKEWDIKVREVYREVVERCGIDGVDRDEAFGIARREVQNLIDGGSLVVPAISSIDAALKKADEDYRRVTDELRRTLAIGQMSLDFGNDDPMRGIVVVLEGGLRKSYRHLTSRELDWMQNP
jgi:hypothetical protein